MYSVIAHLQPKEQYEYVFKGISPLLTYIDLH